MDQEKLIEILEQHRKFLAGKDGKQADLRDTDLRYANLRDADLSRANLRDANLSYANLRYANLRYANLSYANLRDANLRNADLRDTDLRYANLRDADLSRANLSGAKGLLNATAWLSQFEKDDLGVIVFKALGHTYFSAPQTWEIKPSSFLEEVVNPLPTNPCGCGVNFATLAWIKNEFPASKNASSPKKNEVWKGRIRWMDLASVVVPYNTDGKARCGRLELLEVV